MLWTPAAEAAEASAAPALGQENASVSWIGAKAVPCGLTYVRTVPVAVSVTFNVTSTLVRPAAKTQWRLLKAHPLTTLTASSMFAASKNQKYPASPVKGTALAEPVWPSGVPQVASTRKRESSRQSAVAPATHAEVPAVGAGRGGFAVRVARTAGRPPEHVWNAAASRMGAKGVDWAFS